MTCPNLKRPFPIRCGESNGVVESAQQALRFAKP